MSENRPISWGYVVTIIFVSLSLAYTLLKILEISIINTIIYGIIIFLILHLIFGNFSWNQDITTKTKPKKIEDKIENQGYKPLPSWQSDKNISKGKIKKYICDYCNVKIKDYGNSYFCHYCKREFCSKHRQAELHHCSKKLNSIPAPLRESHTREGYVADSGHHDY